MTTLGIRPIAKKLDAIGIESICDYVSRGKSLLAWCKEHKFNYKTVNDWIIDDPIRNNNYAQAKEARELAKFEELEELGNQAIHAESNVMVQGLRLKSDNLKWMLSRMNSKKYGDKVAVGGDGDNVIKLVIEHVETKKKLSEPSDDFVEIVQDE